MSAKCGEGARYFECASCCGCECAVAEVERLRAALEKIAGRREYDDEDHQAVRGYKVTEGLWTTDECLADRALDSGHQQRTQVTQETK